MVSAMPLQFSDRCKSVQWRRTTEQLILMSHSIVLAEKRGRRKPMTKRKTMTVMRYAKRRLETKVCVFAVEMLIFVADPATDYVPLSPKSSDSRDPAKLRSGELDHAPRCGEMGLGDHETSFTRDLDAHLLWWGRRTRILRDLPTSRVKDMTKVLRSQFAGRRLVGHEGRGMSQVISHQSGLRSTIRYFSRRSLERTDYSFHLWLERAASHAF